MRKTDAAKVVYHYLVAKEEAVMARWLYIALRSLTLLSSYINGKVSHLKAFHRMSSVECDVGVIVQALLCTLPSLYLASLSTAPASGHRDRTSQ